MPSVLTRKLELFQALSPSDRELLDEITRRSRQVGAGKEIVREGDAPSDVFLILDGFACRYKQLRSGSRHIFACLVPGDLTDIDAHLLPSMDHTIATVSACTIVDVSRERLADLLCLPPIARALRCANLVEVAITREWLVNLGQRSADDRIGHFFCELHLRLDAIGIAVAGQIPFPFTQAELGETMGLSAVHVNRVLQSLRAQGLIVLRSGRLSIPDVPRLRAMSGFKPTYLPLGSVTLATSGPPARSMFPLRVDARRQLS